MKTSYGVLVALIVFAIFSLRAPSAHAAVKEYWLTSAGPTKPILQILNLETKTVRTVRSYPSAAIGTVRPITIAPSRNWMVYYRYNITGTRDGIYLSDISGKSERRLVSGYVCVYGGNDCNTYPKIWLLGLSRDGKFLMYGQQLSATDYTSSPGRAYVLEVATGKITKFQYGNIGFSFSPLSTHIVGQVLGQTSTTYRLTKLETLKKQFVTVDAQAAGPAISPDQKYLAAVYRGDDQESWKVQLSEIATGELLDTYTFQTTNGTFTPFWSSKTRLIVGEDFEVTPTKHTYHTLDVRDNKFFISGIVGPIVGRAAIGPIDFTHILTTQETETRGHLYSFNILTGSSTKLYSYNISSKFDVLGPRPAI